LYLAYAQQRYLLERQYEGGIMHLESSRDTRVAEADPDSIGLLPPMDIDHMHARNASNYWLYLAYAQQRYLLERQYVVGIMHLEPSHDARVAEVDPDSIGLLPPMAMDHMHTLIESN
jgi:hypothetical protein